jgi:hypothetical protein
MPDISWKQALLGMMVIAMIAAMLRPNAFKDKPVAIDAMTGVTPTPKVVTKVVTKVERVPVNKPDGYMSRAECYASKGVSLQDLMWRYGWPSGDNGDGYAGDIDYPIREDRNARCHVEVMYGHVNEIVYHDNSTDY